MEPEAEDGLPSSGEFRFSVLSKASEVVACWFGVGGLGACFGVSASGPRFQGSNSSACIPGNVDPDDPAHEGHG